MPSARPAIDDRDPPSDGFRFCPRCVRPQDGTGPLCDRCGDRLMLEGFCPVCERHWTLPVGADCPKHEIATEPTPPPTLFCVDPVRPDAWVTVAKLTNPIEATARRVRLEAEGIPTFIDGERMGANTFYQIALGGARLQVPASLEAEARVLLAQNWAAPELADDLDNAWDDLAPEPTSVLESIIEPAAIVAALLMAGLALVWAVSYLQSWS